MFHNHYAAVRIKFSSWPQASNKLIASLDKMCHFAESISRSYGVHLDVLQTRSNSHKAYSTNRSMSTVRWRTSLRSCSMLRRIWLALCFKAVWRYLSLLKHQFRVQFHSLTFWVLMDKTRVFPLSHLTWWRQSLTTQRISSAHVKRKDSTLNTIMLTSQIQKLKTLQIYLKINQTKSKSTLIKRWRNLIPLMAISLLLHYN